MQHIRLLIAKSTPFFIRKRVPLRISRHLYYSGTFNARLYGKKVVKLVSQGHQIENEIYWRGFEGCHEGKSMQIFAEILTVIKPQIVWDIGANSGTYGVLAKALAKDADVYFFEPIPKAADMILANIKLNQFTASVFQVALSDYDGTGEIFFAKDSDFATSVTVNKNTLDPRSESYSMEIQVARADTLIKESSIPLPNLIKLDVETHEFEVLLGFGVEEFRNSIFLIEVLSEDLALKLSAFFPGSDYDFYNINDSDFSIRKDEVLGKSDFYNYLICPKNQSSMLNFHKSEVN